MGKIIELNQHIANQIAAGEVVERPASVIKELIENSLDAKAHNIEVRIKDGGLSHIVVDDDGCGMDEFDVALSVRRYATSKLKTVSDLSSIGTYGFRGEALPSIASVAHMSILSRVSAHEQGTKAIVEGGIIRDVFKASSNIGTRIEVRHLFFNVPARLKFVKSKRAEAFAIDRLLKAYAFIYDDISWKLFIDNQMVRNYSGIDNFMRASDLLGHDTKGQLYPIKMQSDLIKLSGVIASPLVVRRDGRGIIFFVNNRVIVDKKLTMAIKTAFRSLLEVGRNPVCALNIEIAPDEIDVNVHPRKTEVRFRDENRVISHVIGMLSEFLATTPWLNTKNTLAVSPSMSTKSCETEQESRFYSKPSSNGSRGALYFSLVDKKPAPSPFDGVLQTKLMPAKKFSDLFVIGQVSATYLLAESEEGLVVIDQHAAHERVMFEKIRAKKQLIAQPLLIPITIHMDSVEMTIFDEHISDFSSIGIEGSIFGKDTVIIRSLPDILKNTDVVSLISDILSDFSRYGRAKSFEEISDHVFATLSCHSSIRAGQRQSKEEIMALFSELDGIDFKAHCPHGRPIVKSFSNSEMKKWFDRT